MTTSRTRILRGVKWPRSSVLVAAVVCITCLTGCSTNGGTNGNENDNANMNAGQTVLTAFDADGNEVGSATAAAPGDGEDDQTIELSANATRVEVVHTGEGDGWIDDFTFRFAGNGGETFTVTFDGDGGVTSSETTAFEFNGASFAGGTVRTVGQPNLYGSGLFAYEVLEGSTVTVNFENPVDLLELFFLTSGGA